MLIGGDFANLFAGIPCQVRALVVWHDDHPKQLQLRIEQRAGALQRFQPVVGSFQCILDREFLFGVYGPAHSKTVRVSVETERPGEYTMVVRKD